MDLIKSIKISAAGMQAQGTRLRVIAENLANSDSLAERPGESPYRRKLVTFKNVLDRELQTNRVMPTVEAWARCAEPRASLT